MSLESAMCLLSLVALLAAVRSGVNALIDVDDVAKSTRQFALACVWLAASGLSVGYWAAKMIGVLP